MCAPPTLAVFGACWCAVWPRGPYTGGTQSETEAAGWPLRIVMKLKVNDGMNDG